jgi:cell division protein FtsB
VNPQEALDHYRILTSMLAPALLMAATGSLLVSANARLARVVDRLRAIMAQLDESDETTRAQVEDQILRHRRRAHLVLRACLMLYLGLGAFVGTSLALAVDALAGFRLPYLPTGLAVVGVLGLLGASLYLGREVSLSVQSFDAELDIELERRRR